jgi:hypothetical protein
VVLYLREPKSSTSFFSFMERCIEEGYKHSQGLFTDMRDSAELIEDETHYIVAFYEKTHVEPKLFRATSLRIQGDRDNVFQVFAKEANAWFSVDTHHAEWLYERLKEIYEPEAEKTDLQKGAAELFGEYIAERQFIKGLHKHNQEKGHQ